MVSVNYQIPFRTVWDNHEWLDSLRIRLGMYGVVDEFVVHDLEA